MGSTRRDLTRHRTRSYYTKEIKQTKWRTKQQPVVNGSMGCVIAAILWMFTAVTPYTATHVIFTTSLSTWSQGQDCFSLICGFVCPIIPMIMNRGKVRERDGIEGNGCGDCCTVCCCPACAAIQLRKQVAPSGCVIKDMLEK